MIVDHIVIDGGDGFESVDVDQIDEDGVDAESEVGEDQAGHSPARGTHRGTAQAERGQGAAEAAQDEDGDERERNHIHDQSDDQGGERLRFLAGIAVDDQERAYAQQLQGEERRQAPSRSQG